jgi:hypothetical protein
VCWHVVIGRKRQSARRPKHTSGDDIYSVVGVGGLNVDIEGRREMGTMAGVSSGGAVKDSSDKQSGAAEGLSWRSEGETGF